LLACGTAKSLGFWPIRRFHGLDAQIQFQLQIDAANTFVFTAKVPEVAQAQLVQAEVRFALVKINEKTS